MESRGSKRLALKGDFVAKRALVVDSNPVARSAIEILLQRRGWEVIGAVDGVETLRLASAWHFDLLITDPDPSKVPGLQLVRIVKGGMLTSDVRVILLLEEGQWVGEVAKLADDVLFKNGQIDKQLQRHLTHFFGEEQPEWTPGSFPHVNAAWGY